MAERNSNIEILRIIAMIMIITLHYLLNGGILDNISFGNPNYNLAWSIESFCYSSVNCYILISGYFLIGKRKIKPSKVLDVIIQTVFYSVSIYLICCLIGLELFDIKTLITGYLFPITHGEYWYATVYVISLFTVPYISIVAEQLNKDEYRRLIIEFGILLSIVPKVVFFSTDTIGLSGGYSLIWFIYLHFIAGYIRKYNICFPTQYLITGGLLFSILPFIIKYLQNYYIGTEYWNFYSYNSIFVLGASVCFFMLAIKCKPTHNRLINIVASATFGVFLIHTQYIMRDKILWNAIIKPMQYVDSDGIVFVEGILKNVLSIFIVCTIIELIRQRVFFFLDIMIANMEKTINKSTD